MEPIHLPPEVAELLARHAEYRRRRARLSFEEKIAIIERRRELKGWRKNEALARAITSAVLHNSDKPEPNSLKKLPQRMKKRPTDKSD
ncbi:MAG: hypothetical protein ONB46_25000 [candidate division KSB1 bacterium]|nr:hypothetical protein [candidate division KSB1 bacterium]MDZ7369164.1 hypothetical protein [candidate division KSB1 bacterium]